MCGEKTDRILVQLISEEYAQYRAAENSIYGNRIVRGFANLDEFLELAKTITNTRKSRSGKSLEHHLSQILCRNGIPFTPQGVTEETKRPDFMIPSIDRYHDPDYPVERLDVRNGLCLNALHDAAFDTGLMTVDSDSLEIILSDRLEGFVEDDVIERYFGNYEGMEIRCPNPEAGPLLEYLRYHRDNVFDRVDPDHIRTVLELRAEDMSPTLG